jgi:hypothetical protein
MWATGSQWRTGGTHIGDREKASPESVDIRIRDPTNREIPIEATGAEETARTCVGGSSRRVSEVEQSRCLIS